MFRALEHEGIAAQCLFQLFTGGRRMSGDAKLEAFAGCAVLATTMHVIRKRG